MVRGRAAKPGDTRVSANGYHYTRTDSEWRLTHHLVAEEHLGRSLGDNERVYFKDSDKTELDDESGRKYPRFDWDNLRVQEVKDGKENRIKYLKAKIAEYKAELEDLESSSR